jgi:AraC-like DNA-binding protein
VTLPTLSPSKHGWTPVPRARACNLAQTSKQRNSRADSAQSAKQLVQFGGSKRLTMYAAKPEAELLRPLVDCIWYGGGEELGSRHLRLPDGRMQLLFDLSGEGICDFHVDGSPRWHVASGVALQGPRTRAAIIDTSAQRSTLGVSFFPGGAAPFIATPAWELVDCLVDLNEVCAAVPGDLIQRLRQAASVETRFRLVESALLNVLSSRDADCRRASRIVSLTRRQHSIGSIEAELGLHPRGFIAWFRQHVGPSPKEFARLERFQVLLALTDRADSWSKRAAGAGYSDQAHMIREFRSFTGMTPTQYAPVSTSALNHVVLKA